MPRQSKTVKIISYSLVNPLQLAGQEDSHLVNNPNDLTAAQQWKKRFVGQ
jgi:hypothetical protein